MSGDIFVLERPNHRGTGEVESVPSDATLGRAVAEPARVANVWSDYLELTKPRIVTMILIVTFISAVVAAGRDLAWLPLLHLMIGTALVAGSAGVLNQVIEKEIDARMKRTRLRPLPDDRVTRLLASLFGVGLIVVGSIYLVLTVGRVPALVGLATWLMYVAVYTPMKTRTAWNTTVGAIAGALPMQMGYTAAGGSLLDLEGWLLFAVLFLWQYPHFMAIAWMYRRDYAAAGLKMTTVVDPSGRSAGWQSVLGTISLAIVLVALVWGLVPGVMGWIFSAAVLLATGKFVIASIRFAYQPDDVTARRLLRASLVQLPAAMIVLMIAALA